MSAIIMTPMRKMAGMSARCAGGNTRERVKQCDCQRSFLFPREGVRTRKASPIHGTRARVTVPAYEDRSDNVKTAMWH